MSKCYICKEIDKDIEIQKLLSVSLNKTYEAFPCSLTVKRFIDDYEEIYNVCNKCVSKVLIDHICKLKKQ